MEDHCINCGLYGYQELVHRSLPPDFCTNCDLCKSPFDAADRDLWHCARCNGLRFRCSNCRPLRWMGEIRCENRWLCTKCIVEEMWPVGTDVLVEITEGEEQITAYMALSGRLLLTGDKSEQLAFYDALHQHPELVERRLARDGQGYTYSAFCRLLWAPAWRAEVD